MADTNTNELKIVFTIADLASSKIDEINKKWDTLKGSLAMSETQAVQLNKAFEKIDSGNKMLKIAIGIGKIIKNLYDARMESSSLEKGFVKLGATAQDVSSIGDHAFKLSDETGIPVEKILASALKIKSSFKDLNTVNLNALVDTVTKNVLATGNSFEEVTNQAITAGKSFQNLNGNLNQLNFGNITDLANSANALGRASVQFNRISTTWENLKKRLGMGIENSFLIKFGILESILSGVFRTIADGIGVINTFLINNPKLLEFAGNFVTLGTSILFSSGTFLVLKGGLTVIGKALSSLTGGSVIGGLRLVWVAIRLVFSALASFAAANPIGLIVVGIVAAVALIITYWDEIKAATLATVNYILEKWNSFSDSLANAWEIVKGAWMEMPDWAKGLVVVLTGIILGPIGLFLGLFAGIGLAIYNYWDDIASLSSSIVAYISNLWNTLVAGVVGFGNSILETLNQFWNSFLSIGPFLIQQFDAIWSAIWNTIPQSAIVAGLNLMKALGKGILAGLNFVTQPIKSALGFIGSFLPGGSKQGEGPFAKLLGLTKGASQNSPPAPIQGIQNNIKLPPAPKQISVPGLQLKVQPMKQPGITLDPMQAPGINSERSKKNPVLQRFNETIDSDSKRVVRRTSETSEITEMSSGKKQTGSSLSIGSVIGQLVVGDRMANKKKIGEIITDAIFQELDRFEEMELA